MLQLLTTPASQRGGGVTLNTNLTKMINIILTTLPSNTSRLPGVGSILERRRRRRDNI